MYKHAMSVINQTFPSYICLRFAKFSFNFILNTSRCLTVRIFQEQDKIKRFTASLPSRLYSTLLALKAQTSLFRPTFRRRSRQPQRWCSPRRGARVAPRSPPIRIQVPRSDNVGLAAHTPVRHTGELTLLNIATFSSL